MKRLASLTAIIAATVFTVGLMAQGKANFAGKWQQFDPDPAAAAGGGGGGGGRGRGGMGGGWGQTPAITQDATTLTVEYPGFGQNATPQKFVVKLDGTESKNATRGGESTSKATWEGSKLVINTTTPFNNPQSGEAMKIETKRELSLDASGNLVITSTTSGMGGGGQAPTPVTVKYKKAS